MCDFLFYGTLVSLAGMAAVFGWWAGKRIVDVGSRPERAGWEAYA